MTSIVRPYRALTGEICVIQVYPGVLVTGLQVLQCELAGSQSALLRTEVIC